MSISADSRFGYFGAGAVAFLQEGPHLCATIIYYYLKRMSIVYRYDISQQERG